MPIFVWKQFPEITAGTSLRKDGNFSAGPAFNAQEKEISLTNRIRLLSELNFPKWYLGRQTHSIIVKEAHSNDTSEADALITDKPLTLLGINTADCIPVFIYTPQKQALGLVHSGRLGLLHGITENTLISMKKNYGIDYKNTHIYIGPHISRAAYQVGRDILEEFSIPIIEEKGYLDMQSILIDRLKKLGINPINISSSNLCTLHAKDTDGKKLFFSHRGGDKKRMFSFLGRNY